MTPAEKLEVLRGTFTDRKRGRNWRVCIVHGNKPPFALTVLTHFRFRRDAIRRLKELEATQC